MVVSLNEQQCMRHAFVEVTVFEHLNLNAEYHNRE